MWKAILAGTTALAIAGSTLVYAQQRSGRPDGMQRGPNIEDMRAFGRRWLLDGAGSSAHSERRTPVAA